MPLSINDHLALCLAFANARCSDKDNRVASHEEKIMAEVIFDARSAGLTSTGEQKFSRDSAGIIFREGYTYHIVWVVNLTTQIAGRVYNRGWCDGPIGTWEEEEAPPNIEGAPLEALKKAFEDGEQANSPPSEEAGDIENVAWANGFCSSFVGEWLKNHHSYEENGGVEWYVLHQIVRGALGLPNDMKEFSEEWRQYTVSLHRLGMAVRKGDIPLPSLAKAAMEAKDAFHASCVVSSSQRTPKWEEEVRERFQRLLQTWG